MKEITLLKSRYKRNGYLIFRKSDNLRKNMQGYTRRPVWSVYLHHKGKWQEAYNIYRLFR